MKNLLLTLSLFAFLLCSSAYGQTADRWQQEVDYKMEIDFQVDAHQFTGNQLLTYTNHSPDTLQRVFYHLYFNAFQPNSMMDVRSRTLPDADDRVADRIQKLSPDEIGYLEVNTLTQDGKATSFRTEGTILEVELATPLLPGQSTVLKMNFNGQVPVQIRRSGRDNAEGIAYSMSQWYPKLCEYDYQGWHANPYVGREFYGVWGDFDVKITIDRDYIVGATGYLQNPEQVGAGYNGGKGGSATGDRLTYHFVAPQVHDFVWAADPDYTHTTYEREDGTMMHFFYQPGEKTTENWQKLPAIMDRAFDFINERYGQYPYQQYSFIQGGDGGMEYPMATLITGQRSLSSLVGVSVHELMHAWYQGVLANNESLYAWMDEGFTSYASSEVMNFLRSEGLIPGEAVADPHQSSVKGFINFEKSGLSEPLSIHADHFTTNAAYGVGSYIKGSLFLYQLKYIMGEADFYRGLKRYFDTWKFKHPNANDFIRVMEKSSGLELDWFKEYFVYTTRLPDYAVETVREGQKRKQAVIELRNQGQMPMPLDVAVTLKNGEVLHYNIPLRIMRGAKTQDGQTSYQTAPDWPWTHPEYELTVDAAAKRIVKVEIDPSGRLIDTDRENNVWQPEK
ncbi:MAG: M1 family peptidase [Bacteroidetes bacterium]|nr:MAG: M1 family peptidase [Bacteroidota bacterium]